ncbi:transposase [Methylobacterium sp. GC_Met_2]|uniref:transposase n=1 Tax=Methylobacterium sp. GC_Met_2 TaxID=2937376 RepID=UPI0031F7B211
MADEPAKVIYRRRGRCELVHARLRNLGLDRPLARGLRKLAHEMTGFALAMNILTAHRLRRAALA